ncbi:MAG: DUF86 domain-containing protein [Candidatus Sumerlaeaceae bacterium]|nr:DUF86 domain-containing protein [Candidatus Sumerlaeaceae bacterium]
MSERDPRASLKHILDHAREAIEMTAGKTRGELEHNRMLELALTRLVEVVGEAANRIARESWAEFPGIPWLQIVGMRNRLVHGYDVVDLNLLWDTVSDDLPPLVAEIERILSK